MTRRLTVEWPDPRPFERRESRPLRILAASDESDPTLDDPRNREAVGPIDLVVGCGDLSPDSLCFLAEAFRAPMVYVRGNHDRDGPWPEPQQLPVPAAGLWEEAATGLSLLALPWPTADRGPARHDEGAAWRQVLRLSGRRLLAPSLTPSLLFSHVPPRGAGDTPTDPYHAGFRAYRFLLDRLEPPLWLHGHSALAAGSIWHTRSGRTTVVNVTGTVLIELTPPPGGMRPPA